MNYLKRKDCQGNENRVFHFIIFIQLILSSKTEHIVTGKSMYRSIYTSNPITFLWKILLCRVC